MRKGPVQRHGAFSLTEIRLAQSMRYSPTSTAIWPGVAYSSNPRVCIEST
jgi:hypothetical protein